MRSATGPRIVKKYGNRRLYDTAESRYVTLEELAASVRAGAEVRVVDAQTGDDLTQTVLLQMVFDAGQALLRLGAGQAVDRDRLAQRAPEGVSEAAVSKFFRE